MASHPKLVNKQFNSPIGLYSPQNIQEVLDREAQILANGAVGINFQNPDVGKPSNLKNSAVLRMLEEEENRQRNGIPPGGYQTLARPLRENITWPPPEYEHKNTQRSTFKDVVVPGVKRVAWPPPSESGSDYVELNSVSSQVASRAAPASRPVQPPPPSTITLRPNAPVSQAPPPLVTSQPATATFKGGKHLRGDLKWPPECVKHQMSEENRLRLELAKGPACRPKRPNKDYTEFFEQHALNSTYPGYKIPPGTQFFRPV